MKITLNRFTQSLLALILACALVAAQLFLVYLTALVALMGIREGNAAAYLLAAAFVLAADRLRLAVDYLERTFNHAR